MQKRLKIKNIFRVIFTPKPKWKKRWVEVPKDDFNRTNPFEIDKTFKYRTLFFYCKVRFVKYPNTEDIINVQFNRLSLFYVWLTRILRHKISLKYAKHIQKLNFGTSFYYNTTLDEVYKEYKIPHYMLSDKMMKIHKRKEKIKSILK
jgi:hypothetical protein